MRFTDYYMGSGIVGQTNETTKMNRFHIFEVTEQYTPTVNICTIFVDMPIICDEQEQELGFRHLKRKASPFFTYLVIACVKPADVFSP